METPNTCCWLLSSVGQKSATFNGNNNGSAQSFGFFSAQQSTDNKPVDYQALAAAAVDRIDANPLHRLRVKSIQLTTCSSALKFPGSSGHLGRANLCSSSRPSAEVGVKLEQKMKKIAPLIQFHWPPPPTPPSNTIQVVRPFAAQVAGRADIQVPEHTSKFYWPSSDLFAFGAQHASASSPSSAGAWICFAPENGQPRSSS